MKMRPITSIQFDPTERDPVLLWDSKHGFYVGFRIAGKWYTAPGGWTRTPALWSPMPELP
jgi:hypothetical protein